jgi:histidyl-tRNA synthetase
VKIQRPPGMRDFYPDEMRLQNWLLEQWRSVSRRFGFEEYEGPIFEFLDLYRLKSGEGIVSELFRFEDRGGREFAIRPEMTPTLARMVAARANALPRPIKWFSLPRMCRAEKPQRGRLREFFQWNVDILGVDDPLADAEVIAVAVEFFRKIGATKDDFVIRVNQRPLAAAALQALGVPPEHVQDAFELIDRFERVEPEQFAKAWDQALGAHVSARSVYDILHSTTLEALLETARQGGHAGAQDADRLTALWTRLADLGVQDSCEYDVRIVRGLAYYTGTVFEAHAKGTALRALLGGGRYDDLTGMLDGPKVPGVGFGMGDAPVLEFLRELNRLPDLSDTLDVFVIDADRSLFPQALQIVSDLRRAGLRTDYSYKRAAVAKQFRQAVARNAAYAVVVGSELPQSGRLTAKDLRTGQQQQVVADAFRRDPTEALRINPP